MKKFIGISLIICLIAVVGACGNGTAKSSSEKEDTYVFTGTTALTQNDLLSQAFFKFQERIEKNSDGRIKLEYRGGPESIPANEVGEAIRSGAIDFTTTPAAYYSATVPEGLAFSYSEIDTKTELERGAIDYLDEIHQDKLNAKLLGRGAEVKFGLYTKNKIETVADFEGLRLRGTPTYAPMMKALGAEMISMPGGEVFEALDKGVVDGTGWTAVGVSDIGLEDLINYKLAPGSEYYRMDVVNIMNLDKWNDLPEDLQEIMIKTQREVEEEMHEVTQSYIEKEAPKLKEAGVKEVELGEEFQKIVSKAGWDFIEQNIKQDPQKLIDLFKK